MLPSDVFGGIVKHTPLVSLDIILHNPMGEILVGLRVNRPAQDYWFVPGGRLYKNESIEVAFHRIVKTELSLDFDYKIAQFKGVFQHLYKDNFLEIPGFGTHYVVLTHEIYLKEQIDFIQNDKQHREYKWMTIKEILTNPNVHSNTKYYFIRQNLHAKGFIFPECQP